jgi:hypothetical protein
MFNHNDYYVIMEKVKKQCSVAIVIFIEKFGRELIPTQNLMNCYIYVTKQTMKPSFDL